METLGQVLWDIYCGGPEGESDVAAWPRAAEEFAAHVRAEDTARGGTLSAEEVVASLKGMIYGSATDGKALRDHMAAQGRAIAAKDARIAELEEELAEARKTADADEEQIHKAARGRTDETAHDTVVRLATEHDEARAELAKAKEQLPEGMTGCTILFKECPLGHGWLTATNWVQHGCPTCAQCTAESALATLRQALAVVAPFLRGAYESVRAGDGGAGHVRKVIGWSGVTFEGLERLMPLLDATPSEHPDTATLRAIRERAKDAGWCGAAWISSQRDGSTANERGGAFAASLLGDSGPSGGGDAKQPIDWSKHAKGCRAEWSVGFDTHRQLVCAPDCPDVLNERERACIAIERGLSTSTPEEDWRKVESALLEARDREQAYAAECESAGRRSEAQDTRAGVSRIIAAVDALARLREAPRRAAEEGAREALRASALDALNSALDADRRAVSALFAIRVECNEALADHPTVQVGGGTVGALGLINGLFGTIPTGPRAGWGYISAIMDADGALIRFELTE